MLVLLGFLASLIPGDESAQEVDYTSRIRPLLSRHCYKCHGAEKQKSGLRLDVRKSAMLGGDSTGEVIVPGKSGRSDMIRRIRSSDPDERMPPKGEMRATKASWASWPFTSLASSISRSTFIGRITWARRKSLRSRS